MQLNIETFRVMSNIMDSDKSTFQPLDLAGKLIIKVRLSRLSTLLDETITIVVFVWF